MAPPFHSTALPIPFVLLQPPLFPFPSPTTPLLLNIDRGGKKERLEIWGRGRGRGKRKKRQLGCWLEAHLQDILQMPKQKPLASNLCRHQVRPLIPLSPGSVCIEHCVENKLTHPVLHLPWQSQKECCQ